MGSITGEKGVWAYLEGGMGQLSKILSELAVQKGVDIKLNSSVKSIEVKDNKAKEVVLENGTSYTSDVIISNATPHITFNKMLGQLKSDKQYEGLFNNINSISYESPVTKINLAISKLPLFTCLPEEGKHLGATIHINSASLSEIEIAYTEYKNGKCSSKPIIEMTIPSYYDKTLAPEGHHIVNLLTQNTPYKPEGKDWTPETRK